MTWIAKSVAGGVLFASACFNPALAKGFDFFSQGEGKIIVVTDVTDAGRQLTPPTPETPAYYLGRSLGDKLGSIPGDRHPDTQELLKLVVKVLAKQGYRPSPGDVHPPTLYLVVQWGYVYAREGKNLWFLGYENLDDIGAPAMPGMLGPEVFRRGMRSTAVETILDLADEAIYGIILTAFDYETAGTPKPTILWQTRVGFAANGKSMAQALPKMMVLAGPGIGRETKAPLMRNASEAFIARTSLGQLEMIGYEDDPPAPPAPPSTDDKKNGATNARSDSK